MKLPFEQTYNTSQTHLFVVRFFFFYCKTSEAQIWSWCPYMYVVIPTALVESYVAYSSLCCRRDRDLLVVYNFTLFTIVREHWTPPTRSHTHTLQLFSFHFFLLLFSFFIIRYHSSYQVWHLKYYNCIYYAKEISNLTQALHLIMKSK